MSSQRRLRLMVIVLLMVGVMLSACERPFQADTGGDALGVPTDQTAAEPATDTDVATDTTPEEEGEPVAEATAEPADAGESPRPEDTEAGATEEEAVAEEEAPAAEEEAAAEEEGAAEEEAPAAEEEAAAEEEGAAEDEPVAEEEAPAAEEETATEEETTPEPTAEPTAAPTAEPTAPPTTTDPETGQRVHIIKAGENLFRIGLLYNISWVAIADANGITDPTRILVGDELVIPSGDVTADPTPTPTDDNTYTLRPGDTLFEISQDFGVDWRLIAEANGIINPNYIVAGTVLKIPTGDEPGVTPEFTHLVETGETLFLISLNYGVTWDAIAEANDIEAPFIIYPGEELVIPSSTSN